MTEEEKDIERKLKIDVVKRLQENKEYLYCKYQQQLSVDNRVNEYISGNIDNPDNHNLYELLSIERFFYLLSKYEFSKKRVLHFYKFYELIKFSGLSGRRRYKLTPVQAFQFANIYGFLDKNGRRLIRLVYIFVPRKFSKTTSTAAMAVYDMLFGDNNAQSYVGANSYDQAKICFDEIRNIMRDLDPHERHFQVNREKITFKDRGHDSLIQCLTANAKTKDGLNASLVIMDEYAQARNTASKNGADLKNVLTSSMGVREEPLTVVITTASEVIDGPFFAELEGVKAVLRGESVSDTVFAAVFCPDVDDAEDDPNTWHKVQPHLGITVQENYYEKEYENAKLSAENMLVFRTKLLNIFAENEQKCWLSATFIRSIMKPLSLTSIRNRPDAMVSFDLSVSDDFSAVSFGVYNSQSKTFAFNTAYFFPKGMLDGHPNERLYRQWAEKGYLILTDGNVIDYREIVAYILRLNDFIKILCIGYDPYKSAECVNMLRASGAKNVLKPISQLYGTFTAPVESFEYGAKTGHIIIDDNPINAFCFGNAVMDYDKLENCKPIKRRQTQKIDGVITKLMCMREFIDFER